MSNFHSLGTKEHHDSCIGDDASTLQSEPPDTADRVVQTVQPTPMSSAVGPAPEQEPKLHCGKGAEATVADISQHTTSHSELPSSLHWIPDNWTSSKWMTAIRCAVAEWTSLLLLIINPSTKAMGQVR